jgi:hypothetical protein
MQRLSDENLESKHRNQSAQAPDLARRRYALSIDNKTEPPIRRRRRPQTPGQPVRARVKPMGAAQLTGDLGDLAGGFAGANLGRRNLAEGVRVRHVTTQTEAKESFSSETPTIVGPNAKKVARLMVATP